MSKKIQKYYPGFWLSPGQMEVSFSEIGTTDEE